MTDIIIAALSVLFGFGIGMAFNKIDKLSKW